MKDKKDSDEWAQFTIRCTVDQKNEAEESAIKAGQSLAEWIRRAIQEKIDRERNPDRELSDSDLDTLGKRLQPMIEDTVRRVLDKIEKEERERQ
ncbi:MAG TPA: hypothetical protein O0X13_02745 [Methanocorpusculum sp.]|nr:hypothetical protein [Methanocorpusculum sp.]HJK84633.1 hypothetical protein [Methanocorpusculum sp.]